jgi:hypothetical protein
MRRFWLVAPVVVLVGAGEPSRDFAPLPSPLTPEPPHLLQPPTPGGREKESSAPQSKSEKTQEHPSSDQRGTPQHPLSVEVLPPIKIDIVPQKTEENQLKKALNDWGIPIFTGISTLIFLAQLMVFGRQARRLKETVDAMKEIDQRQSAGVAKSIAEAARSADEMARAAKAMEASAKAAETTSTAAIMAQRARIEVVPGSARDAPPDEYRLGTIPKPPQYRFYTVMHNVGQLPAINLTNIIGFAIINGELPDDYAFPNDDAPPLARTGVFGKTQPLLGPHVPTDRYVTDDEIEKMRADEIRL